MVELVELVIFSGRISGINKNYLYLMDLVVSGHRIWGPDPGSEALN